MKWLQCAGYTPARGTKVMLLVSWPRSSISPPGAAPAVIVAAAKKAPAVKSWPPPDWLTKVSVTGWPARRWIGWGVKPKLRTPMVTDGGAGWALAEPATARERKAAAATRGKDMDGLLSRPRESRPLAERLNGASGAALFNHLRAVRSEWLVAATGGKRTVGVRVQRVREISSS